MFFMPLLLFLGLKPVPLKRAVQEATLEWPLSIVAFYETTVALLRVASGVTQLLFELCIYLLGVSRDAKRVEVGPHVFFSCQTICSAFGALSGKTYRG